MPYIVLALQDHAQLLSNFELRKTSRLLHLIHNFCAGPENIYDLTSKNRSDDPLAASVKAFF